MPAESTEQSAEGIVYVLTSEAMPDYVKIGKTNDLQDRPCTLNNTSVPFPFECYYACKVTDMAFIENRVHKIFTKD